GKDAHALLQVQSPQALEIAPDGYPLAGGFGRNAINEHAPGNWQPAFDCSGWPSGVHSRRSDATAEQVRGQSVADGAVGPGRVVRQREHRASRELRLEATARSARHRVAQAPGQDVLVRGQVEQGGYFGWALRTVLHGGCQGPHQDG